MDPALQKSMLYDFYGDLLTDRQKEFYDLYYNDDLSLAEIAENAGISRQGVRDILVRADAILVEMEEKTGLIARFLEVRAAAARIEEAAAQITRLNDDTIGSLELGQLAAAIQEQAAAIKE